MKVAHLTTHLNTGGIPIYILTLACALKKCGVEQIVISSPGDMEPRFSAAGISPYLFDLRTKFAFHPKLFFALPKIIALCKQEKIDLIHAHTRVAQILATLVGLATGIPHVSTSHGHYRPRVGRKIFPGWGKHIIAISDAVRQDLIHKHGIHPTHITHIQNGIETNRFYVRNNPVEKSFVRLNLGLTPTDFAVCMSGRMIEEKGGEDLLLALNLIHAQYPKVHVLFIGDGPARSNLMDIAKQLKLEQVTHFLGNVIQVETVLSACDLFVHPMRVPEGFGLSVAEAMAVGLPITATDQWPLWKSMQERSIGFCVPVREPQALAEAIKKMFLCPDETRRMGMNAAKLAKEEFDIERTAKNIHAIYQNVLNESKKY